jgi:putative transposase
VRRNLFWLSDEQWKRIEPHLPTDVRGVERVDDRRVISGIVHVLKSGCRWCDCPPDYGPPTTIYNRFVRWARRGVWENLFRELAGSGCSSISVSSQGACASNGDVLPPRGLDAQLPVS